MDGFLIFYSALQNKADKWDEKGDLIEDSISFLEQLGKELGLKESTVKKKGKERAIEVKAKLQEERK